jgi:hypothetical protein
MTAATVTQTGIISMLGLVAQEIVQLDASDGETYTTKLGTILNVQATGNEDVDAHLNATWSSRTITINYAGQTDKLVSLIITGKLG